jgi:sugar fermentation stimulation protein A
VKGNPPEIPLLTIPGVIPCRIIGRINRFVVNIEVNGKSSLAHINNTGRLEELLVQGRTGYSFPTPHTKKSDFRLFAVEERKKGALIDTQLQMRGFEAAQEKDAIPWLKGASLGRRNPPLGGSQLDYLFYQKGESVYVEVKSAVLREGTFAMYPDCPSLRGQRHVKELIVWAEKGGASFILFMAALPEISAFTPNRSADPDLCDLAEQARVSGVGIKAMSLYFDPKDSCLRMDDPDLEVILGHQ